jgi:hypothetical protein
MKPAEYAPRIMAVASSGEAQVMSEREYEKFMGLTPEMSFATDILFDAGMLDGKRLRLLQACEREGRDPVAFARHLVKLSRAVRP